MVCVWFFVLFYDKKFFYYIDYPWSGFFLAGFWVRGILCWFSVGFLHGFYFFIVYLFLKLFCVLVYLLFGSIKFKNLFICFMEITYNFDIFLFFVMSDSSHGKFFTVIFFCIYLFIKFAGFNQSAIKFINRYFWNLFFYNKYLSSKQFCSP